MWNEEFKGIKSRPSATEWRTIKIKLISDQFIIPNSSFIIALEERHAGIGHGRIVLIRDAPVVSQHLSLFRLDQPQQRIDR